MDIDLLDDEYILPTPVQEAPPLSDHQEFLSGFDDTPHARRLLEYLLSLGFTIQELSQGLRHPRFLKYCCLILGPAFHSIPMEQKIASIHRVIAQIKSLSDEQIAEATAPAPSPVRERHKAKGKERKEANCNTLRRLSVLASLYQQEGSLPVGEIEKLSCLKLRALRDALRDLEKAGLIEKVKSSHRYFYKLTHSGITNLISETMQELLCDNRCISINSHNNSCIVKRNSLMEILEGAIKITEELRKLGWYPQAIKKAFHRHRVAYILNLILKVKKDYSVRDYGAYLYSILVKGVPEEIRKDAIIKKNLAEVPADLVDVYIEQAVSMSPQDARYFANALRKRYLKAVQKGETLFPGEVEVVANYVRKRRGGSKIVPTLFCYCIDGTPLAT